MKILPRNPCRSARDLHAVYEHLARLGLLRVQLGPLYEILNLVVGAGASSEKKQGFQIESTVVYPFSRSNFER